MRVPRWLAIFGFNLSASVFIGLSVYGILLYTGEGVPKTSSLPASFLFAATAIGSIAGICFFGSQWDRRNSEVPKKPLPPDSGPKKP